mmetsp:Transcript_23699/g.65785  ORF Transcript_23699/g.65785 Transcript_23699/m.65785 type:complete len:536 (+) Transcript_23699:273-1880(+)|eukprot:CAMPEP_0172358928 /NCGR_PEP_ID=MMETSP1060-20121228/3202_1 /TAXON_ID=37318 /ORGANISM="Pseudo-nitzschia pungens, Strain cf. cingulata" /LENGTH=535 /DNA_ID=CAMNT_0013080367 /DNA_START=217 /DNA_END=1824 /DNA_ORIENTATION=+
MSEMSPLADLTLEDKARCFFRLAQVRDNIYLFQKCRSTFVGKETVDSMVARGLATSREEAVHLGNELAEKLDLFRKCNNNYFLPKRTNLFEDNPNRFYRFCSGALEVIDTMNELEKEKELEQKKSPRVPGTSTTVVSGGSRLGRQHGTRSDVDLPVVDEERAIESNFLPNDVGKPQRLITEGGNDDDQSIWTEFNFADKASGNQYSQNDTNTVANDDESIYGYSLCSGISTIVSRSPRNQSQLMEFSLGDKTEEGNDENQSQWTESIIGNKERSKRNCQYSDEETIDCGYSLCRGTSPSVVNSVSDNQSKMKVIRRDCTENTEVSHGKDIEELALQGRSQEPVNIDIEISCDGMSQIPLDVALEQQQRTSSAMVRQKIQARHCAPVHSSVPVALETSDCSAASKRSIDRILRNDLDSCDKPVAKVQSAMESLRRIIVGASGSRKYCVRIGGIEVIMKTMERYSEEEAIQYSSCVIIELIVSMESDGRDDLFKVEWIGLITQSMSNHRNSNRLHEVGRAALATLCERRHKAHGEGN